MGEEIVEEVVEEVVEEATEEEPVDELKETLADIISDKNTESEDEPEITFESSEIVEETPTIGELEPDSLLEAVLAEATNEDDESETPIIDAITDKVSDILAKELESDAEAPIITAISENTGESEDLILDELQAELNGDTEDAPLVAAVVEGIIENAVAKEEEIID